MSKTFTYYLRLFENELQWSTNKKSWQKVTPRTPSTIVDSDDVIDWETDDATIEWIKVSFAQGNIIPNDRVSGNQTKKVVGTVKNRVARKLSDTYTIYVKPMKGEVGEYDPEIHTPKGA